MKIKIFLFAVAWLSALFVLLSIVNSCSKLTYRPEIHIAILNSKGDGRFGDKAWVLHLQDGYSEADSAALVGQLIHDNEKANHEGVTIALNSDDYPYDTAWITPHNKLVIEIPVDIFGLTSYEATGIEETIQAWCDNGYAPYWKRNTNTPYDSVKLIYPNL